jgi:hypothetical protein
VPDFDGMSSNIGVIWIIESQPWRSSPHTTIPGSASGYFLTDVRICFGNWMRTRREQLTASQLMRKNPIEAIVDKDNHLRDALKYILLSLPSPSERPEESEREAIIKEAFETGAYGSLAVRMAQFDASNVSKSESVFLGGFS